MRIAKETTDVIEHHENQFTGWWTPAEIVVLFQTGKINAKELILLNTIDGLVKRTGGHVGCYASNGYLAKIVHVKDERTVRRMISKLKDMGLLIQIDFDGRKRYLETVWSRARNSGPGRGGKNARSARAKMPPLRGQ